MGDKYDYAIALLKTPDDPFKAALAVFPYDTAKALAVSKEWPRDEEIIGLCDKLIQDEGEGAFLPTKEDLARAVFKRAERSLEDADAFKGYKLYADIMGHVEKPGTTVNNNTLVDNRRVMVVTDHGTDDEWEAKVLAQQTKLIEDGARPIN